MTPAEPPLASARTLGSQSIVIYSDPAPWVPKVLLFTVVWGRRRYIFFEKYKGRSDRIGKIYRVKIAE